MPTQVQFRRGTTAQNNSFTGAAGELSVDTDLDVLRVHDGSTAGGFALVGENASQTLRNKTIPVISGATVVTGNIVGNSGTASSSTTTGALVVSGGAGISGALFVGGATNFASTNYFNSLSTANAQITGGTITGLTNLASTTEVATNFSTGNAVITGGSINNVTVGATTHTTGRFTTVTATTVNAGTIGNTGANLVGTIGTAAQTNITSVGTLSSLTVGGTLQPSANATIDLGGTSNYWLNVYGRNGFFDDLTVGAGASTFASNVTVTGFVIPGANLTYDLGTTTTWWRTFYGVSTQARYADLAENYLADQPYEPGTVLVFGGGDEVTVTDQDHDHRVAGVVSTNPAHLMNGALTGPNVVEVGLTGRLPCRVLGPVRVGDVLVTSSIPGVAQKIDNTKFVPGCVIGKALRSIATDSIETIEIVVGRF